MGQPAAHNDGRLLSRTESEAIPNNGHQSSQLQLKPRVQRPCQRRGKRNPFQPKTFRIAFDSSKSDGHLHRKVGPLRQSWHSPEYSLRRMEESR